MDNVKPGAWRGDELVQAIADRLVEQQQNPLLTLLYARWRPVIHDRLAETFGPVQVPTKGGRRR